MALSPGHFYDSLAELLDAGVTPRQALLTAVGDARGKLADAARAMETAIASGDTLAAAMDRFPDAFPEFDRRLAEAGERSGRLPECLRMLAEWRGFLRRVGRSVLSGVAYPAFLVHVAAVVIPLPDYVTGKTGAAAFALSVVAGLAVVYVPALLIWLIWRRRRAMPRLAAIVDHIALRIPFLGSALRNLALSRYCRAFHALFEAGISMRECTERAPAMCGNAVVANQLDGAARSVEAGRPASDGFGPGLPREFIVVWRAGEESGALAGALARMADMMADSAEHSLEEFARWIPRVIYLMVAAVLAWSIISSFPVPGAGMR